ncbi:MAG: DUF4268 domain-containing protein [Ferruginibacter sp.]
MYSKQEATLIRKNFWTVLGRYLAPIPSAGHKKVNWISYKTGVRYIQFHLSAESTFAKVAITITHPDGKLRLAYFNLFRQLQDELPGFSLQQNKADYNGICMSVMEKEIINCNIYRQEDWAIMIAFFKENMILLDAFWICTMPIFEMLS